MSDDMKPIVLRVGSDEGALYLYDKYTGRRVYGLHDIVVDDPNPKHGSQVTTAEIVTDCRREPDGR